MVSFDHAKVMVVKLTFPVPDPLKLLALFFYQSDKAIFILVVSSAVLLYDMSARVGDVSMGIAVFPIG